MALVVGLNGTTALDKEGAIPLVSFTTPSLESLKDSKGRWRTQSLFLETSYQSTSEAAPLYTMRPHDHEAQNLPSFRRLYLEIADPTEYRQATQLLGGWSHWQALLGSKWFKDYIEEIRDELDVKLKSEAIMQALGILRDPEKLNTQTYQFFAEGKYQPKRGKGRPSNEEVASEARRRADVAERVRADAERLGIKVVADNG